MKLRSSKHFGGHHAGKIDDACYLAKIQMQNSAYKCSEMIENEMLVALVKGPLENVENMAYCTEGFKHRYAIGILDADHEELKALGSTEKHNKYVR